VTSGSTGVVRNPSPLERLARSGSLNVAGTLVGGGAGIALVVLVTNGVRQELAGMLFAATSFFLIVTAISTLGTDTGLAHAIQRQLAAGRPGAAVATVGIALRAVAVTSVLTAGVVWLAAPWLADLVSHGSDNGALVKMLRVLALVLPVATAYETVLGATLAYGAARPNVVVEKLGRMPGQILCVLAAILAGAGPTGLTVAWSVPYLFGLIAVGWWCARIVRRAGIRQRRPSQGRPSQGRTPDLPRSQLAREFWAFTAPRALGRICQVALQRTDIVLVAALLSPRDAAIYTAATRFLAFGQLGIAAIQQVLAPQLSGLFARGDLGAVRAVFATSTAWLMSMAWPIYLTSAVAAPVLLRVFGDGYQDGHATVVILSLTMLATTATGSVDVVLLMAGRSRQSLVNNAVGLVVDVALVLVLVPMLGITGAALAWAAALAVRNLLPMLQVRRAFDVRSFGPGVVWVAFSAGVCFGIVPLVVDLVLPLATSWAVLMTWLPLVSLAYAVLLWHRRDQLELSAFAAALPAVPRVARRLRRRLRRTPAPAA
jgi:O-antigen/teichoic acid export membrane protein